VPRLVPALAIAFATTVFLSLALTVNLLPRVYEVREGDVAAVTIKAPRRASYVSQLRTRDAREQAAAQVAPIVDWDSDRIAQQKRALTDLIQAISAVRNAPARTLDQRRDSIRQLATPPLSEATAQRIAELDDAGWTTVAGESQRLLWDALKDRITEGSVEDVRNALPLRASPFLPEANRAAAIEVASRFLRSNVIVNEEATERARREARESVTPVVQMYEPGQTIVRDGQVIGPLELEALQALNLRNPEVDWRSIGGATLLAATLVSILALYVWHFHRELLYRDRRMVLLGSVLVVTTVAAKLVIPGRPLWVYVFPLPAVAMLLSTLLEARLAIVVGVLLSVILGWVAGNSLEIGVIGLEVAVVGVAGTTVGALTVWRKERLHSYFLAGVYVAAVQVAARLAFFLTTRSDDWQRLWIESFELGINGLLSSLLTIGSITLVGRLFGILTTMQLLELANPTQPLLRRLLMEAPGTYHHSIMVGNLAERAAEVIGADSLLLRVAAYYHDIGKLERPWAFIENQEDVEENIHESLDPTESAQIIAAHVTDGVRLADRFGLPGRIRDMIPQHHGTRTISFFYQQAAEQTVGNPDPALFTYPGPRPQSREAAILMLADSTEAAARASRDHSREAINRLVENIVRQRLEEGQFDDCDLTLRDLTRIKESFVTLLTGIYHPRIPYPPSKPAADGSSTPAQRPVPTDVSI
jgi:cyclic-di-AMP phosphodiesterase PgpH